MISHVCLKLAKLGPVQLPVTDRPSIDLDTGYLFTEGN